MKKILFAILLICISLSLFGQTAVSFTPTSNISAYTYDGIRSGVEKMKMNTYILGKWLNRDCMLFRMTPIF